MFNRFNTNAVVPSNAINKKSQRCNVGSGCSVSVMQSRAVTASDARPEWRRFAEGFDWALICRVRAASSFLKKILSKL